MTLCKADYSYSDGDKICEVSIKMKKFCNKISKQPWRVSVSNLNASFFRKGSASPESDSYNVTPNNGNTEQSEHSDNSGSYLTVNSEHSDKNKSNRNSVITEGIEEGEDTDDDQESRYEDASPMYDKKVAICLSSGDENEEEITQHLYADIENSLDKVDDKNDDKFIYDVPKISFSFFETLEDVESEAKCSTPVKSEQFEEYEELDVQPILKLQSHVKIVLALPAIEHQLNDSLLETDESFYDSCKMSESQDDVSLAETHCEISDQKTVEFDVSRLSLIDNDLVVTNLNTNLNLKSGSEPNVIEGLEIEEEEDDGLYKVPTKPYKRFSQSLHDFNNIREEAPPLPSPRIPIIQHHVVLPTKDTSDERSVEDSLVKLDYCNARSKLPLKSRRATLLRRPQMKLKSMESWSNFRTKMTNMIAVHSAAQRVGASVPIADNDRVINLDQIYKSSRNTCKKLVEKSGKLFHKKRGQENVDPNVESNCSDSASQIVKNDAFFAKVDLKDKESEDCDSSDTVVDGSEVSDKFGSNYLTLPREEGRSDFDLNTLKSAFRRSRMIHEGQNGFEDLRKFVKQGGDFCKELQSILQERSEAELQYAKSLSKLSSKLTRACRDGVGSLNEAWKSVACDMESRSEAHRQFSSSLTDDIVKPLKQLTEAQHKQRKVSENAVDKTARGLSDWRAAEAKSKKQSHQCARDNEKLQDALLDVRLSRSTSLIQLAHMHNHKTISDKESAKLEGKKRKAEDAVKKADIEYYTLCVRAERSRLEWESAVLRGSRTFQGLEEERLNNLKSILTAYFKHSSEMCPKLLESTEKMRKPITESEPSKDMSAFTNLRNSSQHVSEQLLPDFYCEHITLAMNRERRKQALVKLLHLIRQDLERERKSKHGLENLSRAIKQTPNFGAEDSQQNVTEKLYHMRSMLTYLEGARFKVQNALAEMENRQRTSHPLATHITITRDKSGLQQSILKVPPWLRDECIDNEKGLQNETGETELPDWTDRGMADGNSNQHDSDFDEFSSQGSGSVAEECHNVLLGQCKALYAYTPNLPDELNLHPGDILSVYRKQEDGWWLGECNGCVGIFPATYVENI